MVRSRIIAEDSEDGRAVHREKGVTVGRSPHRQRVPDRPGRAPQATLHATSTIPIVMAGVSDPVAQGLVASLARPGGNITGLSFLTPDLPGKRLELLKETVPQSTRIAVLVNPTSFGSVASSAAGQL